MGVVRRSRAWMISALVGVWAAGLTGCGSAAVAPVPTLDIVETARATGGFGTLVRALEQTALHRELAAGGPYTLFAPTDAAFRKLPEGMLDTLLEDPARLRDILLRHIVQGEVTSTRALGEASARTLSGHMLSIEGTGTGLIVGGVAVERADVRASNGVVHGLGEVLLP